MTDDLLERLAVALAYDGVAAPRLSARGHGALAEQIVALARENDVPLMDNPELAALLARLDLGAEIPRELYVCVAQIIAFAYRLRDRTPEDV